MPRLKSELSISGTPFPKDCSEITDPMKKRNGSHTIYPFGVPNRPAYVHCEFDVYGTAWTVRQILYLITRPLDLHNNHYVSPSIHPSVCPGQPLAT